MMDEEESPNRVQSRKERAPHERPNPIPRPVVAMTVRIAKELTDALLRLSVERRLRGARPGCGWLSEESPDG